ncbi:MAG: LysR family transcriptional regulator [Betaproteobacteria bacterium]|nr:LysR family transcriptional regulator [Betaproteobacteria bacterium]MDE2122101.1 LysR family transcriptional regulator [Betaproteobacteria bacterium]MDE2186438.1 LysR family transcriptional regulator [Betaproteobacteria bacterium]MDE2324770.1 LysR family transcriptional regulator [Betaproteobacteria bacterium]
MSRPDFNDLLAFVAVARERSFTRAAVQIGVSQSALSHRMRALEAGLGLRLLTRTTRSVSPTEAGERLLQTLVPRFEDITAELAALRELQDKPAGTIRITSAGHAADTILWPRLGPVLAQYPELQVEIYVDYGFTDIVAQRFDAGVRIGESLEKDMIAVRIGPDQRIAVVAAPDYFAGRPTPRRPQDLATHNCINLRLPSGKLLPWEFAQGGRPLNVQVQGQWTFNASAPILRAALAGAGLAYVPEDIALESIGAGRLRRVLQAWCPSYPGYHLYYPSRRQSSRALAVVVDALRYTR